MEPPSFKQMQDGELAWWRDFLREPWALARLFAIYGYRYLPFFFEEFSHLGVTVVDFGSGPVSAVHIGEPLALSRYCVDPLLGAYQESGLLYGAVTEASLYLPRNADTALVLNVLDHCDDPPALLHDVAGRLRQHGRALVWVHVDEGPDALHRRLTEDQVKRWLGDAGLIVERERRHQDYGPAAYMAVATRGHP